METGNKFSLFLIVFLSCHLLSTHALKSKQININLPRGRIPNLEVKKACDATQNPMLCLSSVTPFLKDKSDPISILQSELKAVEAQTKIIIEKAKQISQNPATAQDVKQALTYCKENYDSMITNLKAAVDAIPKHDKGTLVTSITAVMSDLSTCHDTFGETTTTPSPMNNFEMPIKDLGGNCLALASMLRW